MKAADLSDLRLRQLISPNLPTGAFTYSQGLEWAVECGWIKNSAETKKWLQSILNDNQRYLELPLLARLYTAVKNNEEEKFHHWSQQLFSSRETLEFRNEEKQRARALYSVLNKLPDAENWLELKTWKVALLNSQLSSYALAANRWNITLPNLMQAHVWSWLENTVAAAIKLVPLGQSEGQSLLFELSNEIDEVVEYALQVKDDEIGASSPALAIVSSLHETQYSRLFRS
ncbi:Urease accessory protein UreF [hydrothermal vent metagenome]|uniref:Urease accessory protein UreF n=1 Tax=hydrothermal vent metagenome TaxID=652676 RepID=A0A3B0W673_9ZZZZ